MKRSASEAATLISRALISASNSSAPTRSWNTSLEQTLHRLGCRDSLTPSLVARIIDPFLLSHHRLALGFFNWASQQPGFTHTSLTYQSVLKSLSISRQFNTLDTLLKQVKAQRIHLDPSIYRSVIDSQIIGKKTQKAFLNFKEACSLSCDIGPGTCNSLLAALSSDGYIDDAQKVFSEMSTKGISLSTLGFGVFIWKFCKDNEMDKILGLLDDVKKHNSDINGSIIAVLIVQGLCQVSRVSQAFLILEELRSRDCKPDFMAYRIVAEAFRLIGSSGEAEKVLKKKRKLGVAPRANDYREFIFDLIAERRLSEAKDLGEVIVSGDFTIDDDVLNALIGSVSSIDPGSAVTFLKFMIAKGRSPTLLTLSNLSRNLCKYGKTNELLEIFQILSVNEYFSNLESYNVMVSFLCTAGRVKEAYGVLQEMKKKGLSPDVSFYNCLMEACCREDLLRPAKRLWDEMFASECGGNLRTYNILIQKFSEIGQIEDSRRLFHHMLEKGIEPDATIYRSLLEGLCKEKNIEAAFDVFNKSVQQDVMLARTILGTFVIYLCKGGHFLAASELLCGLSSDIVNLDSHVIFLKCLTDARDIPIAINHIKWVGDSSPSMLQAIFTDFSATSSSSSSKPDLIMQLFQAMHDKRILQ